MQKRLALTVFLLVLSIMGVNSHASEAVAQQVFDWQPPEFVAKTAAGKPFHYPGDLQGPTIVLFWASWCPFCKALMPHLQSIIDEYNYEVRVLALSIREDENPVEFLEEYGYSGQHICAKHWIDWMETSYLSSSNHGLMEVS